jgi:hypothetical protein
MSEKKTASDELLKWMDSFRAQLDVGESTMIYKTLKDNKFKTRMQLKLIKGSELDIMFKGETYMFESAPSNFNNMCYPFQTQLPVIPQTQRIFPFNQQFSLGHQNIQDYISSPEVGYTSMPRVQALHVNHQQNNSLDADEPQQEPTALDLLVDAATSSKSTR